MNEHLPECYMPERADWTREWECICHRLRDCERRVEIEQMDHLKSHRDEWVADGYARALEDAALAVERGCAHTKYENCSPCWHDQYAEKIRALRVQHG